MQDRHLIRFDGVQLVEEDRAQQRVASVPRAAGLDRHHEEVQREIESRIQVGALGAQERITHGTDITSRIDVRQEPDDVGLQCRQHLVSDELSGHRRVGHHGDGGQGARFVGAVASERER